ncbi:MAG: hypothetical protein ACRD3W_18315, partial [Terriglobales bacterium]
MPAFTAKVIVTCFLIYLALFGAVSSGIVLREPDICFLLAMGRWICEHQMQLPAVDPFSYTYIQFPPGSTYAVYQWLTEVLFYGLVRTLGLPALLVCAAVVMTLSFVVVPLRILALKGCNNITSLLMVALLVLTSCTHLSVRPEIFSYLFTAAFLELFARFNRRTKAGIDWIFVASAAAITCIWSNMHCLYVLS